VAERLVQDGVARPGDKLVVVYGSPMGVQGQTNSIRFHQVPRPGEQPVGPRYRVPI
jgi:pyruvate kinase